MSFKEKVLSKSNSYNYYKNQNEELLKKIETLEKEKEELRKKIEPVEKENEELRKKINFLENKENNILKRKFANFQNTSSFCDWKYIDFYTNEEYEDKLKEVTKHLPSHAKKTFKMYALRAMVISMLKRDTLYFNYELDEQKKFTEFKINNSTNEEIAGYKFTGDYNLHPFINLGLSEKDLEYIKNKDIIDAGAFTGDTSIPLSKVTSKNIYAFEPFKESFDLLKKNIEDNNIKNIIPVNKSLGNINGERTLYLSGNNVQGITSDSNIRTYNEELKVEEVTVDEFVKENNLDVGYITVDVEGAEMDLLNGAINTIKTQKPILFISIYHKVSDYYGIIPWIADLDLGYEFNIIKENPWTFLADTIVTCKIRR